MHSARLSQKQHPNSRGSSGPAERGLWGQSRDSGGQWEAWTKPESLCPHHTLPPLNQEVAAEASDTWRALGRAPSCTVSCPWGSRSCPRHLPACWGHTHSPALARSAQCPQCRSAPSPQCQPDAFSPRWGPGSAPSSLSEAGRPRPSRLGQAPKPSYPLTNQFPLTEHTQDNLLKTSGQKSQI